MKNNNFDFLRVLFALFVVIAHSYPLSGSSITNQLIYQWTNGQIELSNIGLNGFFIISGYLIFKSLERCTTIYNYLWKRILRLFPALFIVLLLTILLAPLVYENQIAYNKNNEVLTYLPRNLSLYNLQFGINGIFESNPHPKAINGSLWTICYEFTLYLILSVLFFIKSRYIRLSILLIGFIFMLFCYNFLMEKYGAIYIFGMQVLHFFNLGTFFIAGSLLAVVNFEIIKYKFFAFVFIFILVLIALHFNLYDHIKHILLTLLVLLFGLMAINPIDKINVIGDISYGVYIYSFPIQQTLMYCLKLNTIALIISSVLISILFGYFSWHLIEKRMLILKNKF